MIGLTGKQAQLLTFIRDYHALHNGVSPSFDEMCEGVNLASKSGVSRLIERLEEKGRIVRLPNRARAIAIVEDLPDLSAIPTKALADELMRRAA